MANPPRDQVVRPLPILTVPPPMTLVRIILKSFVFSRMPFSRRQLFKLTLGRLAAGTMGDKTLAAAIHVRRGTRCGPLQGDGGWPRGDLRFQKPRILLGAIGLGLGFTTRWGRTAFVPSRLSCSPRDDAKYLVLPIGFARPFSYTTGVLTPASTGTIGPCWMTTCWMTR